MRLPKECRECACREGRVIEIGHRYYKAIDGHGLNPKGQYIIIGKLWLCAECGYKVQVLNIN